MINAADFFYERGDLLVDLLTILNKGNTGGCSIIEQIQIYKFGIAVQLLQKEGVVYITKKGKNCTMILSNEVCDNLYELLFEKVKKEMDVVEKKRTIEDGIFLEKVKYSPSNWLYFQEYVKKAVNDEKFVKLLKNFCDVGLKVA